MYMYKKRVFRGFDTIFDFRHLLGTLECISDDKGSYCNKNFNKYCVVSLSNTHTQMYVTYTNTWGLFFPFVFGWLFEKRSDCSFTSYFWLVVLSLPPHSRSKLVLRLLPELLCLKQIHKSPIKILFLRCLLLAQE